MKAAAWLHHRLDLLSRRSKYAHHGSTSHNGKKAGTTPAINGRPPPLLPRQEKRRLPSILSNLSSKDIRKDTRHILREGADADGAAVIRLLIEAGTGTLSAAADTVKGHHHHRRLVAAEAAEEAEEAAAAGRRSVADFTKAVEEG